MCLSALQLAIRVIIDVENIQIGLQMTFVAIIFVFFYVRCGRILSFLVNLLCYVH